MRFARDNGIETDFISTDLHRNSIKGTAYDQPTTFSKLLNLGMPLEKVIAAGSTRPSAFLDPTKGDDWLTVGQKADLTVFRVDQTKTSVKHKHRHSLNLNKLIHAVWQ